MKQWYEELFLNYAKKYDQEPFTHGTVGEVDFIERELGCDKSKRVLDIGCGTGRHSIELAKRGYSVKGFDLSDAQIKHAKDKAAAENVSVDFSVNDARSFNFNEQFDIAIMLCEGGFSLMETDEMNFEILKQASQHIKTGGKFIFTCLNALYPLNHSVKELVESNDGVYISQDHSFDMMTFREKLTLTINDDADQQKTMLCNERYYAPSEITWMLKSLNFTKIDIFGARLGEFNRDTILETSDYEMLVVAEK